MMNVQIFFLIGEQRAGEITGMIFVLFSCKCVTEFAFCVICGQFRFFRLQFVIFFEMEQLVCGSKMEGAESSSFMCVFNVVES